MYVDTLSRLDQVAFTAFFALVSLSGKLNVKHVSEDSIRTRIGYIYSPS